MLFVKKIINTEKDIFKNSDSESFCTGDCKGSRGGGNNGGDRSSSLN